MIIAKAWGKETHKGSEAFGEVVNPIIFMWEMPGPDHGEITGAIEHGAIVTISDEREVDGRQWVFGSSSVWRGGQNYPQVGWILKDLLLPVI
jgi:hypothetical protein